MSRKDIWYLRVYKVQLLFLKEENDFF